MAQAKVALIEQKLYRGYMLWLLTLIVAYSYVDRLALGIVLQDIKTDLQLTDTQLGLLTGVAFALFYSVMGIPIARWADRGNRVTIISLSVAVWSAAVAVCGAANNFIQLLLIRVGIGTGEAGCIPTGFSLIADYFNRGERPRAAAIYGLSGPIACLVGFLLSGWLNSQYGWRLTFLFLGAPGILLAALAWLTLKEPRRVRGIGAGPDNTLSARALPPLTFKEVFPALWRNKTYRALLLAFSVLSFFGNGILQWQPTFLIRSFGLSSLQAGTWLTLAIGVGGFVGVYLAGELATRFADHNERLQLRGLVVATVGGSLMLALAYLSSSIELTMTFIVLYMVASLAINGPLFAAIQTLMPDRMRAVAFSVLYLCANLIGLGFGPLAVGAFSDAYHPYLGEESLRYALLTLVPTAWWGAWFMWKAGATIGVDVAAAASDDV